MQIRKSARRDHAHSAPKSRERIAKFPKNFGAPRAQKLRALSMRSEKSNDIFKAPEQITSALPSKKRAVGVEITQSFAPKSRERIAEFLEFRRAARTKKCMHSACLCAATRMTSLKLFTKSCVRWHPNKRASGVEITQTLHRNRMKKLQIFRNFLRTARAKFACTRPTYVV